MPAGTGVGRLDNDGEIGPNHLRVFSAVFGSLASDPNYYPPTDADNDHDVDGQDLSSFLDIF